MPPDTHPTFLRNGMTSEVVAVGFVFGEEASPEPLRKLLAVNGAPVSDPSFQRTANAR